MPSTPANRAPERATLFVTEYASILAQPTTTDTADLPRAAQCRTTPAAHRLRLYRQTPEYEWKPTKKMFTTRKLKSTQP